MTRQEPPRAHLITLLLIFLVSWMVFRNLPQ